MAGADLERVVDLLRPGVMDEQFRLLGAGTLLVELRSAVSAVYNNGTVSRGANLRLMFCIQSQAAPLRELLDAVVQAKLRSEGWRRQVPGFLLRNGFSRSTTLRDLRQLLAKFRALASYVREVDSDFSTHNGASSSSYSGAGGGALAARMVGRSELLQKMVDLVLSDGTGVSGGLLVMPIVGGPGVGKTRLAMALLSDGRVRRRFTVRLAVPVMQNRYYSIERVLLRMSSDIDRNGRELRIRGNYLIVLDDVWSHKDGSCPEIGALMKALPSNGTLVVTTRTPRVASYLATVAEAATTNKPFYLQPLEQEFTSSLTAEWTATDAYGGDWPAELAGDAGMAIANKCGGVPLLLEHGRARFCRPQGLAFWQGFLGLGTQHTDTGLGMQHFWRDLLACIDGLPEDEFWHRFLGHSGNLPDGNAVLESGAVSYQHLSSDMRSCLLYCSMFPIGHDFDVDELTDLLATEGYIPAVVTKAQSRGFIQQLLDECFYPLQEHEYGDRRTYRMHKVLHIFVQYMDRETSSVIRADHEAAAAAHPPATSLRRASLLVDPSVTSFPAGLFQCHHLGALVLLQGDGSTCPTSQPRCEITGIPQELSQLRIQALSFRATKVRMLLPQKFLDPYRVKYLNLSQTDIENIPRSISRLMFLHTLILSYCGKLQKLHPNTTKLALLQKLDLEGCFNLVELPRDLIKMKRLEYLNVAECSSLTQLPRGMGQLTNLQILLGYAVSNADDGSGSSLSALHPLEKLHRLSLLSLEKVSDPLDARFSSLSNKTNLESLSLRWEMGGQSNDTIAASAYAVLESLRPHRRLKALEIVGYEGENLPSWITSTEPYLISLVEIKLINMTSCESVLPPLGLLPCLKIAEISGADAVCSVKGDFYGHRRGAFRSLENLTLSYMQNLEVWEQAKWSGMFPRLKELAIIQCPKLRALQMELPSLRKLVLWMNNKVLYSLKGALQGVAKTEHITISFAEDLLDSSGCEGLQDLGKLTKLEICGCDELTCLPQGLQHLSSIRSFTVDNCSKLEILPDWLENLPYLQVMRLSGCPLLHSIPGRLQRCPGMIIYVEDCPNLIDDWSPNNFPAKSSGKTIDADERNFTMLGISESLSLEHI